MRRLILSVDDDKEVRNVIQNRLMLLGYEVITAQNGLEALELLQLAKPSLILLDYRMPEMDGLETLKRIKALDRQIPVVMVTGIDDNEEGKKALDAGASDYVTKPIDFKYLQDVVLFQMLGS